MHTRFNTKTKSQQKLKQKRESAKRQQKRNQKLTLLNFTQPSVHISLAGNSHCAAATRKHEETRREEEDA